MIAIRKGDGEGVCPTVARKYPLAHKAVCLQTSGVSVNKGSKDPGSLSSRSLPASIKGCPLDFSQILRLVENNVRNFEVPSAFDLVLGDWSIEFSREILKVAPQDLVY
jgi:hypothetical protein